MLAAAIGAPQLIRQRRSQFAEQRWSRRADNSYVSDLTYMRLIIGVKKTQQIIVYGHCRGEVKNNDRLNYSRFGADGK
jgi:hypothetical protein